MLRNQASNSMSVRVPNASGTLEVPNQGFRNPLEDSKSVRVPKPSKPLSHSLFSSLTQLVSTSHSCIWHCLAPLLCLYKQARAVVNFASVAYSCIFVLEVLIRVSLDQLGYVPGSRSGTTRHTAKPFRLGLRSGHNTWCRVLSRAFVTLEKLVSVVISFSDSLSLRGPDISTDRD